MFSRALLIALCIVYVASSLTPLSAPADDDCALYLTGPGRSSAYDYSLNLLKGNFAYDGQHTCITYDAINQAYLDARTRILVSQPKGDWKAEDFASAGELILDISISLARTYGLTYEEIEKGLPLIDTSRTLIREVCPPVFSHVECRAGKYRRLDGLCNNLRHPTWGATMAPFQRLIGPLFADGINAPRIAHTGRDLPLSRVVSRTMHPDEGFHDHAGTVMVIAWGQFMDHDYTLTGTPLDPIHRNDPEECCKRPPHLKHPYCNEIRVPDDDYFYRLFGVKCIDFVRGFPSPRPGCRLGSRVPFNTLTGAIDGNTVYGVTEKFARKLRTGYGGLLRMNPVFKEYGLKDLLPLKLDIPDEGCTRPNKNMYCFEAGEIRVNEQLVLTVMHTLMAREHNRVAKGLAAVNPHWDDETLFQEARRINIAEIQHITYNEFLPILLGKDVMEKFGLVLQKEGYWDGYDQEVNPDVIASFASAAYRFGHSLLPTAVERWSKAHKFIASKRLSDLIRRPYDLYRAGVLDEYVMGLMNQVAQAMDDSITQEVTNHLFKKVGARFGMDLVSFNMQRGREFGIPGYMEFRKFCGLSGADSFQDLFGSMSNETIQRYESIFEHPIDVDLWSGGVSERPLAGSMLGPTFACIIATQFSYSRRGDRFWFELPNQPSSFTPEQLAEIRKSRLARVICDNTDIIDTVQLYPMVLPDHELNPRVPCRSGIIPSMDFSKWAEPVPFIGGAKEYMTDAYLCDKLTTNSSSNTSETNLNIDKLDLIKNEDYKNKTVNIIPQLNDTQEFISNLLTMNVSSTPETIDRSIINTGINCINETNEDLHSRQINQLENNDKILKYVYKIKESSIVPEKTKGHLKNSLKRKKRSENSDREEKNKIISSELFDHDNRNQEELTLPDLSPDAIVKIANLADFNIRTLHNIKPINVNSLNYNNKNSEKLRKNVYLPIGFSKHNENLESNDSPISKESEESNEDFKNEKGFYTRVDGNIVPLENSESSEDDRETSVIINNPKHNNFHSNNRFQIKQKENKSDESELDEESREDDNLTLQKQDKIGEMNLNNKRKEHFENQQTSLELNDNNDYKKNAKQIRHSKYDDSDEEEIIGEINLDNNSRERGTNIKNSDEEDTVPIQDKEDYNDNIEYTGRSTGGNPENNEFNSNKRYYDVEDEDATNRSGLDNESKEFNTNKSKGDDYDRGDPRKLENPDNKVFKSKDKYHDNKKEKIINERFLDDKSENHEDDYDNTEIQRNSEESQDDIDYSVIPITQEGQNYKNYHINKGNTDNLSNPRQSNERNRGNFQNDNEDITINRSDLFTNHKNGREKEFINDTNGHILEINNDDDKSIENNRENNYERQDLLSNKYKTYDPTNTNYSNDSGVIQDVDLDDFGHERIQLNNIGQVEPDKDLLENFDDDSNVKKPSDREEYPVNINKNDNFNDDDEKQVKIDGGEVRPVVELNDEDSGDSEDVEDASKERINAELKEEIEKNIHTHEETSKEEVNDKLTSKNKEIVKDIPTDKSIQLESLNGKEEVNVKQQFERIPVNYNHTAVKTNTSIDTNDENYNKSEGTLDSFLPKNKNFDENLNIKFTDVNIKLPEIKLPDDILSYAYEEPVNESEEDEYKDTYYVDSDKDAEIYEKKPKKDKDNDDFYSSYLYKPQEEDPDKHENFESHEDLYEKFVRERFGKNTPTIDRSEKSVEYKTNLQLPKNVKNIYKKATKTLERGRKKYLVAKYD